MCIFRLIFNCKIWITALLIWLVNSLNNNSDTAFIIRIFCIISIKISNSLLGCMFFLYPIFNKILNLSNIHKLNIVNMAILLSFDYNTWRNTFVTHCFWIWLMIFAFSIYFISDFRRWKAVITFWIRWMYAFAFQFLLL
jgi:hypothetical protein